MSHLPTLSAYESQLKELLACANTVFAADEVAVLNLKSANDGIDLRKVDIGKKAVGVPLALVTTHIMGMTPSAVAQILMSSDAEYYNYLESSDLLQQLSTNAFVRHETSRSVGMVTKRDFVVLTAKFPLDNGSILILTQSVAYPVTSEIKGCTRGHLFFRAWMITPTLTSDDVPGAEEAQRPASGTLSSPTVATIVGASGTDVAAAEASGSSFTLKRGNSFRNEVEEQRQKHRQRQRERWEGRTKGSIIRGVMGADLKGMINQAGNTKIAAEWLNGTASALLAHSRSLRGV